MWYRAWKHIYVAAAATSAIASITRPPVAAIDRHAPRGARPALCERLRGRSDAPTPPASLLQNIIHPKGYNIDLHEARVLEANPEFKGAVWAAVPPGVVLFHNSGFSNWYPFIFSEDSPGQFFVDHEQQTIRVNHAEAILMAVKERIGNGKPLGDCLARHAKLSAKESKQAANLAGAYPLWADHTFQVLLGASACLLKFSQDAQLREALLGTGNCVLIECAPNDGAWGVAKNSKTFLDEEENPEHYNLQSTEESEISFTAGKWSGSRQRRHTNALGKGLIITRRVLERDPGALKEASLQAALEVVLEELRRIQDHGLEGVQDKATDLRNLFACH